MEIIRDHKDINVAVQALWLQYMGLTIEAVRTGYRVENAAWNTSPPPLPEDLPGIGGLMVAT